MPSTRWTLHGNQRLLELSVGGRWYLGFTVAVGIVAIYSGNNVIYLLESLLLSALLMSGVLSELTLSRLRVSREQGNIHAGVPGKDVFIVENLGKLPLYCIELGEYDGAQINFSTFLLIVPGRTKMRVSSKPFIESRGRHRWAGLATATSFPFGFARKIKLVPEPGSRIVWPKPIDPGVCRELPLASKRGELEVVEGEVNPVQPWQDASRVHWPISARVGELMARPQRWIEPREEIWLELRPPGPEMEVEICRVTGAILKRAQALVLLDKGERLRIEGRSQALDALALLPKEAS